MATDHYSATKERTRSKIHQAFIEMLQEQDYESITVRDIAAHAGVGFKTFYRHYHDKSVLADELVMQIWQDILQQIQISTVPDELDDAIYQLLVMVRDNLEPIRALLAIRMHVEIFPPIIRQFSHEQVRQFQPELFHGKTEKSRQLHAINTSFFLYGQLELVQWWVDQDMVLSMDLMVVLMKQLVTQSILSLQLPADLMDTP